MSEPAKLHKATIDTALARIGPTKLTRLGYGVEPALDHLRTHLENAKRPWCDPACLARAIWGQSTATTRAGIRQRFSRLQEEIKERYGMLLIPVKESGGEGSRGRLTKFKLYEGTGIQDEELSLMVYKSWNEGRGDKYMARVDQIVDLARERNVLPEGE